MPNLITATGIQTASQAELVTNFTAAYESIYGADINLDQDSPDGQMMMIFIQEILDLADLVVQIFNGMDPDNAIGAVLDYRVAINGIQRQAGTFTVTNITIVVTQALNLPGLDQTTDPVYTVSDNAGNKWELIDSQTISAPGTHVYAFQSAVAGAVFTIPNTITVPVTIVLGVASINNPTAYTTLGINEETDAALKIRRSKSVSLSSQGYLAGLIAALDNITGMVSAFVYENNSSTTNGDGVPSHSIWVIISGTVLDADVAQAIYTKRNAGCGMFGDVHYTITQVDGSSFVVSWDVVVEEPVFIKFTATSINGVNPPSIEQIIDQLPGLFIPGVNQEININQLGTFVQQIDPNTLVTLAGFSTSVGGSYTNTLSPATKKNQLQISSADIIILPIILSPTTSNVAALATEQFTPLGGRGAFTYAVLVNNSGGSIDSAGLYTAGSTNLVTDTIQVTDSLGNLATATVNVT